MANSLDVIVNVDANIRGLQQGMQGAVSTMQGAAQNLQSAGQNLTLGVTAPLLGMAAVAVSSATTFNANLANVASLGVQNVETYKASLEQMAIDLGTSTTDLSAGLYDVVSAFGVVDNSMFILQQSAVAGKAGLASTQEAMSLLSAVTKGYGDTSSEAVQKASDLAFTAVRLGQTTFPELAASMGRVVPLTATLGVRQEELFNVMATATGVTGGAAEVSTQMRQTLQALLAPTEDMTNLIKEQGFESGAAMVQSLGYLGTIQAIKTAADETGKPLQKYISGIEGQTIALALTGNLADQYTAKMVDMEAATGATQAAFEAQTQGVNAAGFAMQQARAKMQILAERLGDGLGPAILAATNALSPLADMLLRLADVFAKMPAGQQTAIVAAVAAIAALGPALMVLGTMVSGAAGVLSFLGTLAGILAAIVSPVGLVIAALAGLAAAILYFDVGGVTTAIQSFVGATGAMLQMLWQSAPALGEYIMAVAAAGAGSVEAKDAFSVLPEPLQDIAAGFTGIIEAVSGFVSDAQTKFGIIQQIFADTFDAISWIWSGDAVDIDWWWDVTAGIESLFNMEPDSLDWLSTALFDAGVAAGQFKTDIETAFAGVQTTVTNAFTNASAAVTAFGASETWATTLATVQTNATSIWTSITGAFTGQISLDTAWTNIQTALTQLHTDITTFLTSESFATFAADIAAAFGLDTLAGIINEKLAPIKEALTTTFTELQTTITTQITGVQTTLDTNLATVQTTVTTQLSPVTTTMTGLSTAFTNFQTAVQPAVEILQQPLERLGTTLSTAFANIGTIGADLQAIIAAFGGLGEALQNLLSVFSGGDSSGEGAGIDWQTLLGGATLGAVVLMLNGLNASIAVIGIGFGLALNGIKLSVELLTTTLQGFTQIIEGIRDGDWSTVWQGVQTVFQGFHDWFIGVVTALTEALTGFTTAIGGAVTNTLTDMGFDESAAKVQAFVDGIKGFFEYINGLATGTISVNLPIPDWLEGLKSWTWPVLPEFSWPDFNEWSWPDFNEWSWPEFNDWEWPEIEMPDWVASLLSWRPFGGNQLGTSYWHGGPTWIGEAGPEPVWFGGPQLVNLPRGARIMNNTDAMRSLRRGGNGGNVTINANVRSDQDLYRLAQMIQDHLGA